MSISGEISRINGNITAAYNACQHKGATMPQTQNSANLAATIAGIPSSPIYGVSGLASDNESQTLTRTDSAIGKSYAINSATGEIASDFNTVFPWNEAEIINDAAGKFLKMPEMYFRVGVNASSEITDVAVSKAPNSEGSWYKVDPFCISCYGGSLDSNDKLKSVSGAERQSARTRAVYREYAAANGSEYHVYDLYHRTVMMFLWLIEFATRNNETVMTGRINGSGTQGGKSVRPTGGTDNLTTPSGYELDYGQMRYHYIEDFCGNLRDLTEGIECEDAGSNHYVTANPADYGTKANMSQLSYSVPAGGCIAAFGWDSDHPFLCMPVTTIGFNAAKYFGDEWAPDAGKTTLTCGVSYINGSGNLQGMTRCAAEADSNFATNGARLIKEV